MGAYLVSPHTNIQPVRQQLSDLAKDLRWRCSPPGTLLLPSPVSKVLVAVLCRRPEAGLHTTRTTESARADSIDFHCMSKCGVLVFLMTMCSDGRTLWIVISWSFLVAAGFDVPQ